MLTLGYPRILSRFCTVLMISSILYLQISSICWNIPKLIYAAQTSSFKSRIIHESAYMTFHGHLIGISNFTSPKFNFGSFLYEFTLLALTIPPLRSASLATVLVYIKSYFTCTIILTHFFASAFPLQQFIHITTTHRSEQSFSFMLDYVTALLRTLQWVLLKLKWKAKILLMT